jgi:hypothetical protein
MSGQQQGDKHSVEQEMTDAPAGGQIDIQEASESVNSGKVEAEEQPQPQDELRPGNAMADKLDETRGKRL